MSVLRAARTLGEISGWSMSNLAMQKVLYIAQMMHLSRTGAPLFPEKFEAWDYGPVVPALYHKAKMFGSGAVQDIFYERRFPAGTAEAQAIQDAYEATSHMTPGQLVTLTHSSGGGWAANYEPHQRGRVIANSEILAEWRKRQAGDRPIR